MANARKEVNKLAHFNELACFNDEHINNSLNIIDEHLQALEIIVKKGVDVAVIETSDNVRAYNFETRFIRYHRDELTQEEYDLVSKVVKELDKGDDTNG